VREIFLNPKTAVLDEASKFFSCRHNRNVADLRGEARDYAVAEASLQRIAAALTGLDAFDKMGCPWCRTANTQTR
jgi:hypothetical protein